jgi:hypothetical protein
MTCPIEFYTNDELITELMKRKSFVGIIISADNPFSAKDSPTVDFDMYCHGFDMKQVESIFAHAIEVIETEDNDASGID